MEAEALPSLLGDATLAEGARELLPGGLPSALAAAAAGAGGRLPPHRELLDVCRALAARALEGALQPRAGACAAQAAAAALAVGLPLLLREGRLLYPLERAQRRGLPGRAAAYGHPTGPAPPSA